jgi:plastocyanin
VTVQGTEFRYDPATVTVNAGSSVQLTLRNTGTQVHDWTVTLDGQRVQALAQPGQSANITFTPSTAGTYQVFCDQPGHQAAGMVGQLVVQ